MAEFGEITCEDCLKPVDDHSFIDILMCAYGGLPTKNGTLFDRDDAEEVKARLLERLDE